MTSLFYFSGYGSVRKSVSYHAIVTSGYCIKQQKALAYNFYAEKCQVMQEPLSRVEAVSIVSARNASFNQ